jgi:hypothetical protein
MIVHDFQTTSGWAQSKIIDGKKCPTRAAVLWYNLNRRIIKTDLDKNRCYLGVTLDFSNFQEFAEWCQHQYGYTNKDINGKYWNLDKDISGIGNYSKEGCLFIPEDVNKIFSSMDSAKGYDYHKASKKFRVRCCGEMVGLFDSEEEAAEAYIEYKRTKIIKLRNRTDLANHEKFIVCIDNLLLEWEGDNE